MKKIAFLLYSLLVITMVSCSNHDTGFVEDTNEPASTLKKPAGIYVLSNGNSASNIRDYDFVTGYTLRFNWGEFETTPGNYNFTVIDETISKLQNINKKLTLEPLVVNTPQHVLDNAAETWNFSTGSPVPWDENSLQAWNNLAQALANHMVALPDGTMVRLADHPTLVSVDSPIMGLSGIRDISGELVNLPSYERSKFINAVSTSVGIMRQAFPNKYGFLAAFKMDDANTASPLDEAIINQLMTEYNGEGQLTLGLFQELLSDVGPTPDGMGRLLNLVWKNTYIMFQALTSWTNPFTGAEKVTSGTPATGIELGFTNYDARYFELYISDIDNEALWNDLRTWSAVITAP